jgi:hypothetical protein
MGPHYFVSKYARIQLCQAKESGSLQVVVDANQLLYFALAYA